MSPMGVARRLRPFRDDSRVACVLAPRWYRGQ
jgi:hypothetical protein